MSTRHPHKVGQLICALLQVYAHALDVFVYDET